MAIGQQHELHARRRGRNLGVLAGLLVLVGLLFAVTLVKLGPDAQNPSAGVSWGDTLKRWISE